MNPAHGLAVAVELKLDRYIIRSTSA